MFYALILLKITLNKMHYFSFLLCYSLLMKNDGIVFWKLILHVLQI